MRSVYLQKDKSIFKVTELPADKFAASLGLPGAPKIKFLKKANAKKNASHAAAPASDSDEDEDVDAASSSGSEQEDAPAEAEKSAIEAKVRMFVPF